MRLGDHIGASRDALGRNENMFKLTSSIQQRYETIRILAGGGVLDQ